MIGTVAKARIVSTETFVVSPRSTPAASDRMGTPASTIGSRSASAPGRETTGSDGTCGDCVIVPVPTPAKVMLDRNRVRPAASRLSARPATAWSTPNPTASTARTRPNTTPDRIPTATPASGPNVIPAHAPNQVPVIIAPSRPMLTTPDRSAHSAPMPASRIGAVNRSEALVEPSDSRSGAFTRSEMRDSAQNANRSSSQRSADRPTTRRARRVASRAVTAPPLTGPLRRGSPRPGWDRRCPRPRRPTPAAGAGYSGGPARRPRRSPGR